MLNKSFLACTAVDMTVYVAVNAKIVLTRAVTLTLVG